MSVRGVREGLNASGDVEGIVFHHLVVYVLSLADVNVRHYSLNPLLNVRRVWGDDELASQGSPINYPRNDKIVIVCSRARPNEVSRHSDWSCGCARVHWLYVCIIYKMIH